MRGKRLRPIAETAIARATRRPRPGSRVPDPGLPELLLQLLQRVVARAELGVRQVVEGAWHSSDRGNPFDVSRNGTLVYHPGRATDRTWPIVWLDSSGKTEPLVSTPGNYSSSSLFSRTPASEAGAGLLSRRPLCRLLLKRVRHV